MSTQSVMDLIGADQGGLEEGYVPNKSIVHIPPLQLGDGLAGPENDQLLQIFRDDRPLAVDELGMGHLGKLARRRAGRFLPMNYEWGGWFDDSLYERVPVQEHRRPSPMYYGQSPDAHDGVPATTEVVRNPRTVFFTGTPQVGWEGW